ncbi:hypothetical protein V500_07936 [Pseudogymnoascus sp. VKM F-4518 (FW-2643)]|nr:hypothetical protein V500_07936 [Pseudogymnoascus sp. VKM F-4518 (FW-2643)]
MVWTMSKHASLESSWVILYDKVYNVTKFLSHHPGGSTAILQLAGQDATEDFDLIHPRGTLEDHSELVVELGDIDVDSLPKSPKEPDGSQRGEIDIPMSSLLSLDEIEELAARQINQKGLTYYASATDDQLSKKLNNQVYRSILLRPRVFVDCTDCDLSASFLGQKLGLPVFISPAAMARLAHPTGECGIASACSEFGALQIISHNASIAPEDIVKAGKPGQVFAWQLYVLKDIKRTEAFLARINKIKEIKYICLTVDAPFPGKREDDVRFKNSELRNSADAGKAQEWGTEGGLTWANTIPWLRSHTSLPIIVKGIQTHEDAYIASKYAPSIKGIILSNHGGRALDTAPPPVHTLLEIRKYCPEVFEKLDVLIDGGIKRGTDVVKALALGAKAVGIGRAALWGLVVGGPEGVHRTLEILSEEIKTAMRLLGVQSVAELSMKHVNIRTVEARLYDGASELLPLQKGDSRPKL